ncbi:hypothetical protein [Aequorivita ciconiae]|uniref:hypothetical protein n=1 Tax=Aequorivita ciconiae TaxID=2494375 RepID=UPI00196AD4B4|nr:hypothetical protein [Aequorivita sp. H23M31]
MKLFPTYLMVMVFILNGTSILGEGDNENPKIYDCQSFLAQVKPSIISANSPNQEDCKFKEIPLYGKVKFVESFGDIKIKFVESFADIKVKFVTSFPNDCGKWQVVESFPDFTVQIVESFPDLKVEIVDSYPGMN